VFASPPEPETVSTWLIAPLLGPDLRLPDLNGKVSQLSALRGQPVLLTFFRANCTDSSLQLKLLQKALADLSAANIALFAVVLSSGNDRVAIDDLVRSAQLSFPVHLADERAAGAWNIQYRYLFDRRRDLPSPVSFLLDASGPMIRVYSGVVKPRSVIDDAKSTPETVEGRLARAMPFPGPYYGAALKHDYLSFGIAFSEYGYADEAQAAFQSAIDDDPGHEVAWFNLGTIYLNKKMYSEARRCLNEAVHLNPRDSDAWNNLGSISGTEEKYDEALQQFTNAAQANPNHLNSVVNMMRIYQFQGRAADAEKAMQDLVARAPDNADLHLYLAMTLVAENDLVKAREELETSIRLRPSNPDAINNLGAVLLRLGLSSEALERFDECRRLSPDFDRAVINSALLYNRAGQHNKARQILEEFLSRYPENTAVREALKKMAVE
jgi:tetratricopeptide (TPR) repeat protein